MNEREAWIALASTSGVGDVIFGGLLTRYGSARVALEAVSGLSGRRADRDLAGMAGVRLQRGLARAIRAAAEDPTLTERRMAQLDGWIRTPLDTEYPTSLHGIEEPPTVLYGLGDPVALTHTRAVAVVGTRRPSAAARDLATRIGRRLAEAGVIVVSGLAVGIDGAAHLATLEAGGETIAVAGSGLDAPGPTPHRRLARRIVEHGAIVSELPPGSHATHGTFPRRNRIISALSRAAIVVEAPARSGALITARHALEQGRQLLVAPGRPLDPHVAGNLALLRESPARPLIGLDEMLADLELGGEGSSDTKAASPRLSREAALALLEPTQRRVAEILAEGPQNVDTLCRATALEAGVVAASLTMLQLRGWVRVHGATHLPAGPLAGMDNRHAP